MDRVTLGFTVWHCPIVFLQNCDVTPINGSPADLLDTHAPDQFLSVRPLWSANRGRSFAGWDLEFLRNYPSRREKEFFALDKQYLACKGRVVSLDAEVESLVQKIHLFKDNDVKLETKLAFRISKASPLDRRVVGLEARFSLAPAELLFRNEDHDRYK